MPVIQRTKIIQLLDRFHYGGAERVAQAYQETLQRLNYDSVITFALSDPPRKAIDGVVLFDHRLTLFYRLIQNIWFEPVLLFCHTTISLLMCCLLRLFFLNRVHIVYIRHFQYTRPLISLLTIFRIFVKKAILITPVEEKNAKRLFGNKVFYINNYINHENSERRPPVEIKAWSHGRKIIAFSGSMKTGKYPEHLLMLALELGTEEYCYLFIGDGPDRAIVNQLLERHKHLLEKAVFFCGLQDDVISILKNVDYFFFSSWNHYEMMPMVLLEALTAKCICFGYQMEINKSILPSQNLFAFEDFKSIKKAIQNNQLLVLQNPYDSLYGKQKIAELLSDLS